MRTVEGELEKALHQMKMTSDFNFGDLKKIGWGRATRTDKKVHALINTFSAKVLVAKCPTREVPSEDDPDNKTERKECTFDEHLEDLREKLNKEALPADVKIFSIMKVANQFNAKNCTSFREYSYFLPTFMLTPLSSLYLVTPPRQLTEAEEK